MTGTDKTAVLAAERQQPLTAAEQAEQDGHQAEWTRDVPRICVCLWQFARSRTQRRYVRVAWVPACPYHVVPGGN